MIDAFRRGCICLGSIVCMTLLISGCMDDPSPVGSQLIPDGDLLQIDTVAIVANISYSEKAEPISFANTPATFGIGKSESFEAWGLLGVVGIPDTLAGLNMQSAELSLRGMYHLGNPGPLSLNLHKASVDWNRPSFVYDSLMAPGTFEASSTPFDATINVDTATVVIPLDTALVRSWFQSVTDTTVKNYGLVIEPRDPTGMIMGFANTSSGDASFWPVVRVLYKDATTGSTDTLVLTGVITRFVAGMADTTGLKDSTLLTTRAGAAYRSVVGFDIATIPAHALVHRAYLDVHTDSVSSRFASVHHDSLHALFLNTLNPIQISQPFADSGQNFYRFNVTEFVQAMVHGSGSPQIILAAYDEEGTVELFRIFGSAAADQSKRPRLTVLYSATR